MGESQNTCKGCGRPTANPLFCSRSCAAKVNNMSTPKRRPEGQCSVCGTPLSKTRKVCVECREREALAAERQRKNLRKYRSLSGAEFEIAAEEVSCSKEIQFSSSLRRRGKKLFDEKEKAGALLDYLVGLCFAGVEYLTVEDAKRHVVMLNELANFKCRVIPDVNRQRKAIVRDTPIYRLSVAMREWVFSYFSQKDSALLPSYALDTACFVEKHMCGTWWWDPEHCELLPLVQSNERSSRHSREFQAYDKREFTMRMGRVLVLGVVPEGATIRHSHHADDGDRGAAPGRSFAFEIERCHLSEGVYDVEHWLFIQRSKLTYDIGEDCRFWGRLLFIRESDEELSLATAEDALAVLNGTTRVGFEPYTGHGFLPWTWITHSAELANSPDQSSRPTYSFQEVPRWAAEVSYD